jgi:hypothetical protein
MYSATRKWFAEEVVSQVPDLEQSYKGHGRIVTYRVWVTDALNEYFQQELRWPWPGQVMQIERSCWYPKTDKREFEVHYAVCNLLPQQVSVAKLFEFWRGHWHVENKGHWVLDVVMGEDASTARKGNLPAVLSLFRSAVMSLLRLSGMTSIASARSYFSANIHMACSLIGIPLE